MGKYAFASIPVMPVKLRLRTVLTREARVPGTEEQPALLHMLRKAEASMHTCNSNSNSNKAISVAPPKTCSKARYEGGDCTQG